MSDLRKQIRDHYEARELPPEKLADILARGRAAAGGAVVESRPVARGRILRILSRVAVLIVLVTAVTFLVVRRDRTEFAAVRPVVIGFFAHGELKYPILSPDPVALRQWALDHGAPADFRIPASLGVLPGKGCTILDVGGKPVHMLCFMTVRADGKQDGGMVHLLIARQGDFLHAPSSTIPEMVSDGEWNFASWSEGEITYTVAAPLRGDDLRPYMVQGETLRPLFLRHNFLYAWTRSACKSARG